MSDRSLCVRRKPGEKYLPECLKKTVKYPTKVMIWSVISAKGIGALGVVDGNMNQHQCKQVLQSLYYHKSEIGTQGVTVHSCTTVHHATKPSQ